MNVYKVATTLALSAALAATLAAAPQGTKAPATTTAPVKTADKAATKAAPEVVKTADLPKVVTDAVMKLHPKGNISGATKSVKGSDTIFAIKGMDSGKAFTINLKADGTAVVAAKGKGKGKGK